jgi:ribosome biogenesis GTPase / thiamine phosphate phosphatase
LRGLVIRSQSGFYTVQTDAGQWVCRLRGRLKRGPRLGDVIAVGDRVEVTPLEGNQGVIEEIEPRRTMLIRLAPDPHGVYQQILIANPDQAVFVFACADPQPHLGMLDRFLVVAERQSIPALIVANKLDLVGLEHARSQFGHYGPLGYPVVYTSALTRAGLDELWQQLTGKISILAGPSGVGKSSLLNAVQSGLGLAVREISRATSKGRHTTVVRELFPLAAGGYVADTPGLKAFGLWDIEPEEIDGYFPELRRLVSQCQFSDCTHLHEPGCAVLSAVSEGQVHPERYQSYLRMRFGDQVDVSAERLQR